jgi:hypothetical protein
LAILRKDVLNNGIGIGPQLIEHKMKQNLKSKIPSKLGQEHAIKHLRIIINKQIQKLIIGRDPHPANIPLHPRLQLYESKQFRIITDLFVSIHYY